MPGYIGLMYQDLVRRGALGRQGKLPPILLIVLYHGPGRWTASARLAQLCQAAPDGLAALQPEQRSLLTDQGHSAAMPPGARANPVAALFQPERSRIGQDLQDIVAKSSVWLRDKESESLRLSRGRWIVARLRRRLDGTTIPWPDDLSEVDAMLAGGFKTYWALWEREAKKRGRRKGRREGRRLGLEEGRQADRQADRHEGQLLADRNRLLHLLSQRFGDLPVALSGQITQADAAQLDRWADRYPDSGGFDEIVK